VCYIESVCVIERYFVCDIERDVCDIERDVFAFECEIWRNKVCVCVCV